MNTKNVNWSKIVSELIVGITGGVLLGILSFVTLMNYGGNYGCTPIIDNLFGTRGYESCGAFGALAGVVIGSLIGIILIYRTSFQKNQYKKITISSALSIIIFPLIIGIILFWPPFEDSDLLLALPVIPIFILLSLIPSLLMTSLLNWKQFLKNRIK